MATYEESPLSMSSKSLPSYFNSLYGTVFGWRTNNLNLILTHGSFLVRGSPFLLTIAELYGLRSLVRRNPLITSLNHFKWCVTLLFSSKCSGLDLWLFEETTRISQSIDRSDRFLISSLRKWKHGNPSNFCIYAPFCFTY